MKLLFSSNVPYKKYENKGQNIKKEIIKYYGWWGFRWNINKRRK